MQHLVSQSNLCDVIPDREVIRVFVIPISLC